MQLSEGAQEGLNAESSFWLTYHRQIYSYLFRLTGEPETAEDLTQETFMLAIREMRRSRGELMHESAWLYRIATNRAIDLFRRRRLIAWLPFRIDRHGGSGRSEADSIVEKDLVQRTLQKLPPEAAAAILLRDGEGFTIQEIADMLGHGYEAVRKRISRAREAFREEYVRCKGDEA